MVIDLEVERVLRGRRANEDDIALLRILKADLLEDLESLDAHLARLEAGPDKG